MGQPGAFGHLDAIALLVVGETALEGLDGALRLRDFHVRFFAARVASARAPYFTSTTTFSISPVKAKGGV
jgi:hypothetical protein